MSVGVKMQLNNLYYYNNIKSKLIADAIEFYTHDYNPAKTEHFMLSGNTQTDIKGFSSELQFESIKQ